MRTILLTLLVASLVAQNTLAAPAFALYQLSMAATNQVLIWGGDNDGVLTAATAIGTQGTGYTTGNVQSQHSLTVAGGFLFAVNPGSNTVSQFSISASDPTQLTFVATAATGGDWPDSVSAYSKNGRNVLCVVNTGAVNNGLRCFTFSATGMTVIPNGDRWFNETLTTPPVSHTGPSQVSILPDGSGVVVIDKTPPTLLAPPYRLYTLDTTTNLPSAASTNSGILGAVNFAGAFDSDGTFVTVDAGNGVMLVTLTTGSTPTLSTATAYASIAPAVAPCWIERAPLTGHFWTGNAGSASVTEFSRSSTTITVIRQVPVGHSLTDVAIATVNGDDYLFVNAGATVIAFELSATAAPENYQNVTTGAAHPSGLAWALATSGAAAAAVSATVVAMAVVIAALAADGRLLL